MKNNPLVTISIPTYNSEAFIKKCLDAIKKQTYKNIEINVIDGHSRDKTIDIIRKYKNIKITQSTDALLGARYEGAKHAKGSYILLLDSDQILQKDAIKNAVNMMKKNDMLILEETVYQCKNWIEKLFKMDRKLIQTVKDYSPMTGVMLPRFYKRKLLLKVFKHIPQSVLKKVGGQDHAIIYYEGWKESQKVSIVPNAVAHIEPNSLKILWKKFYRWGYTSKNAHLGKYDTMLQQKEHFRKGLFQKGLIIESFGSILLLILKGIPYKLGYFKAKVWHH